MRDRVAARSSLPLRQLVQMLYESADAETSVRRAAAALGISVDTTGLYMEAAERSRRAVDAFQAAHPTAAAAVFVTAASFEAGVPELAGPDLGG